MTDTHIYVRTYVCTCMDSIEFPKVLTLVLISHQPKQPESRSGFIRECCLLIILLEVWVAPGNADREGVTEGVGEGVLKIECLS